MVRRENIVNCCTRISLRFFAILLFLHTACGESHARSTWLLRFTGFQHVSGQDLLTHFCLGNLPTSIKDTATSATPVGSTITNYGEAKWTWGDMLRLLALADAIICYLAMFFKAILVQLAQGFINPRRVGYLLELEEAFLSLYRQLLPIATSLPLLPLPSSTLLPLCSLSLSLSLSLSDWIACTG